MTKTKFHKRISVLFSVSLLLLSLIFGIFLIEVVDAACPPGMKGYWNLDANPQTHLGTVADDSGNGNTGTFYTNEGATNKAVAGKVGGALNFDGVNDYVQVMIDVPEYDFTINVWAKTSLPGGLFSVNAGSFSGSSGHDRHMYVNGAGYACFRVWKGSGWCTNKLVNDNKWHHWALVVGTGIGQKAYIDGVLVGTNSYDYSDFNWQDRITVGYSADIGYFNGLIDEVAIYNRALTAEEIKECGGPKADSIHMWGYCNGPLCSGHVFDKTCTNINVCEQPNYDAAHYCQYEGNYYFDAQSSCEQGITDVAAYGPVFNIDWDNDQADCECIGGRWIASTSNCCGDDGGVENDNDCYQDIGLRMYDGTQTVTIAVELTLNSPLRIAKGGTKYSISLVDPSHPSASKIRVQTSSGIKALRKI